MPQTPEKQPFDRGTSKLNAEKQENDHKPTTSTCGLLAGADEYFAAGMRYPAEIEIHKELYDIESRIPFENYLDI
jgi:hypothetical protein